LGPEIAVLGVQPPGREERLAEPPIDDLPTLAAAALDGLFPHLNDRFAFLGTSIGALLAYEIASQLRDRDGPQPVHLLSVGSRAPHMPEPAPIHDLPDENLLAEIRRYGATPEEVLGSRELAEVFLPLIRADCRAGETYLSPPRPALACPVTVMAGIDDHTLGREHLEGWRAHTSSGFTLRTFVGGHLFFEPGPEQMLVTIRQVLG
jgi:medium-chain acyl-[acyl-carrier-protein] hydrolase